MTILEKISEHAKVKYFSSSYEDKDMKRVQTLMNFDLAKARQMTNNQANAISHDQKLIGRMCCTGKLENQDSYKANEIYRIFLRRFISLRKYNAIEVARLKAANVLD